MTSCVQRLSLDTSHLMVALSLAALLLGCRAAARAATETFETVSKRVVFKLTIGKNGSRARLPKSALISRVLFYLQQGLFLCSTESPVAEVANQKNHLPDADKW